MLCMRKKLKSGEDWPLQREESPGERRRMDLRNSIKMGPRDGTASRKFPQVAVIDGLSHH